MKKLITSIIGTVLLISSISAALAAPARDEGAVLRIGAQPFPLYSSIYVAKELGFIDEELKAIGATYTWSEFRSGPLVNEAVAAGTQDIGFMADQPAIIARASGMNIEVIANVAVGERALAVLVPTDSKIAAPKDLKGKKVAYVTGSYAQHLLALVLNGAGLSFSDIESVNLAAADQPLALQSGQVDALVVWEQYISMLENRGTARVLIDGTGIKKGNMVTYALVDYAQKHPLVIEAYIKACKRASDFIEKDPASAAAAIADNFGIDAQTMERILTKFQFSPALTKGDIDEIRKVKDYILAEKIIQNDIDIDKFINTSYLKAAGITK
ncbi:MAG: aliphatic sulfonate ABC transporter substrate-binding protein [Synergistaceae bacterium]|jgi:sulfonate transport system substrate-binding protein|nr:aliphatic sulfonate ABC transporter substrate-binding protein [Synergistaceae bacterium]